MVVAYDITVRETPKSNNAGGGGTRTNKYAAHREKKHWEGIYLVQLMAAGVSRGMTHCSATVELHFARRNHRDKTNYYQPVFKPLADALVIAQYLPDDTEEFFEAAGFTLTEGEKPWRFEGPLTIASYMKIRLEATYE
jgi:hypothetical protein